MKILRLYTLFYLMMLAGCKEHKFTRDIAPALLNKPSAKRESSYKILLLLADSLKLDRIENGYDPLQIRLWVGGAFTHEKVAVFKRDVNGWHTSLITFDPHYDERKPDSLLFFTKKATLPNRNIQWPAFIDSLIDCNIMGLRDQSELQGYEDPTDGISYIVEVATKTKYHLYSYHEPEVNLSFKDARQMTEIVKIVERNTGYDFEEIPDFIKKGWKQP